MLLREDAFFPSPRSHGIGPLLHTISGRRIYDSALMRPGLFPPRRIGRCTNDLLWNSVSQGLRKWRFLIWVSFLNMQPPDSSSHHNQCHSISGLLQSNDTQGCEELRHIFLLPPAPHPPVVSFYLALSMDRSCQVLAPLIFSSE